MLQCELFSSCRGDLGDCRRAGGDARRVHPGPLSSGWRRGGGPAQQGLQSDGGFSQLMATEEQVLISLLNVIHNVH